MQRFHMSVITIDCLYIRLAYKSSPDFFHELEARAVDFFYVFCGKSERES